jgi:hypothetical protein
LHHSWVKVILLNLNSMSNQASVSRSSEAIAGYRERLRRIKLLLEEAFTFISNKSENPASSSLQ